MNPSFKPSSQRPIGTKARSFLLASIITAALYSAPAATIYSTGFESPVFVTGNKLVGQDGWVAGAPFLSPNAATITNTTAQAGLQSVQVRGADMVNAVEVDPLAAVGAFVKDLNYDTAAAGLPLVKIQSSVRLNGPLIGTGDFFSANLGARSEDGAVELSISSDGMIYGYSFDNTVIYNAPITLNAWHTLGITMDFAANTYTFSFDGTSSSAFPFNAGFTSDVLLHEAVVTYAYPDTATNHRADFTAYYDNVSATAVVPEPASVSLLAFGCIALLNFRRRQSS